MRYFYLTIALAALSMFCSCRRNAADTPTRSSAQQPGETFIVQNEKGEKSGSVTVDQHDGVPRLTVDVRGE